MIYVRKRRDTHGIRTSTKKIQGTLENRSTADSAGCSCFVCGRRTAVSAEEGEAKKFTVCGLNSEETIHLLNKKAADTLTVRDYVFYGESLGLYTQTYDAKGDKDELAGKNRRAA